MLPTQGSRIARMIFVKMSQHNLTNGLLSKGLQHVGLAVPLPGINERVVQKIAPNRERFYKPNRRITKLKPLYGAMLTG